MDAQIRRYRDRLICSGYAVIAFGLWSIIRVFLMKLIDPLGLDEMMGIGEQAELETFIFIILIIFLVMDLLVRWYIGRSAISEGRGFRRRTVLYVVLAAAYAAVSVWSDISFFIEDFRDFELNHFASVVIDLSSCVALIEIVVASLMIRKAEKREGAE